MTVEERTTALLALPEAKNLGEETIIPSEAADDQRQPHSAWEAAFAAIDKPSESEPETVSLTSAANNATSHAPLAEDTPATSARPLSLREKAIGWLKRAFDRLVAWGGSRLTSRAQLFSL
ncbi:MAG: hypothetical protein ONA90_06815 [candidate division KSB1 bacterium]|nr:hypothetical protein [candidate division KSB1 bacterium]